jgi:hypothetical protein
MQPSKNIKEIIINAVKQADDRRSVQNISAVFWDHSAEIKTEFSGTTSSICYVRYADHISGETFNDDTFLSEIIGSLTFWAVTSEFKDPIKKHFKTLKAA